MENLLQRSRFELKYIISEAVAREVRSFARNHLMPDPFARAENEYSYNIYSVYLDGPRLPLMNQTLEGLKNRFKLRVRFYDADPDHQVFFEIKRRQNDAIIKQRAKVRRASADRLMYARRDWPDRSDLSNPADDRSWSALVKFCELRDKMEATPRVLVCYNREAWCAPEDDSVRVTFDRQLEAAPYAGDRTFKLLRTDAWVRPRMQGVVLELKFTDRFPNWMRQMVQTFGLNRCSMPKYITCTMALTPEQMAEARRAEAARELAAARRWEQEQQRALERAARQAERPAAKETAPSKAAPVPPGLPVPGLGSVPKPAQDLLAGSHTGFVL